MVHYTTASLALSALALLGSSAVVNAHYVLTSPLTRGFSDDDEPTVPCGGFDSPVNPVAFPLKSSVSISAFHSAATVNVSIKIGDAADFTQVTSVKVDFGKVDPCSNIPPWNSTFPVDLSKLKGATAGAKAVIQTVFDGPDGALYQCADVVLGDATGLPARTDEGAQDLPDLRPTDLCTVPQIGDICPKLVCPTGSSSSSSALSSSSSSSAAAASSSSSPSSPPSSSAPGGSYGGAASSSSSVPASGSNGTNLAYSGASERLSAGLAAGIVGAAAIFAAAM